MSQGSKQLLSKARSLVKQYTEKQLYLSAAYWADKALSLSEGDPNDLATYAQALCRCKDYQRASHLLHSSNLLSSSPALRYLAGMCHAACEEWEEVLALFSLPDNPLQDHTPPATPTPVPPSSNPTTPSNNIIEIPSLGNIESSTLVLKGRAHEGLGDLHSAVDYYKQALLCDVYCEEALERLCEHQALTEEEEKALIEMLPFKTQCSLLEEMMLKALYLQKFHHTKKTSLQPTLTCELKALSTNIDILCNQADLLFQHLNVDACYQLTSKILEKDPYHRHTILLHVACCVQKKKFEELFSLGYRFVNTFPNSALSWYIVACYYIVINKHQNARKYLTKAITLEANFGHAHVVFGLSFAMEGEHDQAISAFSNAARTMRGSHLPLLYLGKEYCLTGVISTGTRFMKNAFDLAPTDPYLLQEIGFVVTMLGVYSKAERYFKQAVSHLQAVDPHMTLQGWEPVYNNLGHILRKQQKYDEALKAHLNALQLEPNKPSTLTALAFIHLLKGEYEDVVHYSNQSLRLKRDDQFTLEVLHIAMEEMCEQPLDGGGAIPDLSSINKDIEVESKMILHLSSTTAQETAMNTD